MLLCVRRDSVNAAKCPIHLFSELGTQPCYSELGRAVIHLVALPTTSQKAILAHRRSVFLCVHAHTPHIHAPDLLLLRPHPHAFLAPRHEKQEQKCRALVMILTHSPAHEIQNNIGVRLRIVDAVQNRVPCCSLYSFLRTFEK